MALTIKVDPTSLRDVAKGLGNVLVAVEGASVAAINAVIAKTSTRSQVMIGEELRLAPEYIKGKMTTSLATDKVPTAAITAKGKGTVLTRFAVTQLVTAAPKAKGDKFHGISAGMKQAGIRVVVKEGGDIEHGFLVKLKNGNGLGVFTRVKGSKAKGAIRHRLGPSVDQAFKAVLPRVVPDISKELEEQAVKELDAAINKVFQI